MFGFEPFSDEVIPSVVSGARSTLFNFDVVDLGIVAVRDSGDKDTSKFPCRWSAPASEFIAAKIVRSGRPFFILATVDRKWFSSS